MRRNYIVSQNNSGIKLLCFRQVLTDFYIFSPTHSKVG